MIYATLALFYHTESLRVGGTLNGDVHFETQCAHRFYLYSYVGIVEESKAS